MNVSETFWNMFLVVIQLGAILAVCVLFFYDLNPFSPSKGKEGRRDTWVLWGKIVLGCIPAAAIGLPLNDWMEEHFYNAPVVALALIVYGVLFIVIENWNKGKTPKITSLKELDYTTVMLIGVFQLIAAIFPGTSRSGATIVGALLLGVSRTVAAEFTFFLAIPVMFGASLLKVLKFVASGIAISGMEVTILLVGMVVAFLVSVFVIRFLMGYIKKHDFKVFGWYRIVLGILVLGYFMLVK